MYSKDSFLSVLRRRKKQFSLDSCPYISDSSIKNYTLNNILSISGPSRSGKSLLISHIIADLITTKDLQGKVVLIDTDNSFDLETLNHKIENKVLTGGDKNPESYLSNLLYLPVNNTYEFNLILKSLSFSLKFGALRIHSLVIDSVLSLQKWIVNYGTNESSLRKFRRFFKKIITLCKAYAIFLIYTDSLDPEQKYKTLYAKVIDDTDNHLKYSPKNKTPSPESKTPTKTLYDYDLSDQNLYNDLLISLGASASNDYNHGWSSSPKSLDYNISSDYDRYNIDVIDGNMKGNIEICDFIDDTMCIKSIIPENWIAKSDEVCITDRVSLFMTISRNLDKNYISFVSNDYRNKSNISEENKEIKVKQVTRITSFNFREIIESARYIPEQNIEAGEEIVDISHDGTVDGKVDNPDISESKLENDENIDNIDIKSNDRNGEKVKETPLRDLDSDLSSKITKDHLLKVYRIDSRIKLTECSYKLLNI
ncbi:uncharacterized protein TA12290 [Theileria annulata]|uniref:DNA recombination and repair protein Rad51-like C-terminal domain-containing protein n=1 Tax=Theileria annulata TaxID=5874 RepID=Q4UDY2_THEAN|nr:uncharacterized protein TA12290 [Theileria annulata]CAI74707.1 hypothetical protein TA12290 [Theileria annulata]|eukprot:XP_952439.1 hypothetical protein TA12290 [Theileria annulata]